MSELAAVLGGGRPEVAIALPDWLDWYNTDPTPESQAPHPPTASPTSWNSARDTIFQVRMYLSSWRLGTATGQLLALTRGAGSAAVIGNALDCTDAQTRRDGVAFEISALNSLGYNAVEVDLRIPGAAHLLADHDLVWVRGGNVFALRAAMAVSGADAVLADLIASDTIVYAGYSAGCCVLSPSLHGLEMVDDPRVVDRPRWDGLGLLSYAFLPHYRSDHPESAAITLVAADYTERGVPFRALCDGEVVVIGS
ncbi:Type 1 glutamine amidotransferase-like domain-containing protein [Parasphingorhabdus pacifica]